MKFSLIPRHHRPSLCISTSFVPTVPAAYSSRSKLDTHSRVSSKLSAMASSVELGRERRSLFRIRSAPPHDFPRLLPILPFPSSSSMVWHPNPSVSVRPLHPSAQIVALHSIRKYFHSFLGPVRHRRRLRRARSL